MSGHGAVGDLRGALADVDHVAQVSATLTRTTPRLAQGPPGTQAGVQLTSQIPFALNVNRLIDRLLRHPHLRIVGKVAPQPPSDLLRAVLLIQPRLYLVVEQLIGRQLAGPRTARLNVRTRVRQAGAISRPGIVTTTPAHPESIPRPIPATTDRVALDLTHHRRRMPAQSASDHTDGLAASHTVLDLLAFLHRQPRTPSRDGLVNESWSHSASISKPEPPCGHRHADSHPSVIRRHSGPHQFPEPTTHNGIPRRPHQQPLS
ncbi:hypothetical protein PICSAR254_04571 [Mycobacterium avium subsp. paratuberculosis]|nr:hypothetical protein B0173_03132 [Mycobacterium avium subsp. paratuberculosis]CAG7263386.1 hypothetical protein PICSAR254_04571 [Mycobacterium avium subsp. paratuberculosis]CAG7266630.1 hypothetical protein PICSAR255_04566 [Mycobacterium avium subsp. paratuberculosis]CAG7305185.1 hypothetical protein PICSAR36_04571 [Mycobacterium avium subsp. paratuberculosis]